MPNDMLQLPYVKVGNYLNYVVYSPERPSPVAYNMFDYKNYCEAKKLAEVALENNIELTITPNSKHDPNFAYLAWCGSCQDGLNACPDDANDWVRFHAKKHGLSV